MSASSGRRVTVNVGGRALSLSNLDKVLYPDVGFTKAEVIDHYSRLAPVILPHLRGRPLTVKRYPNGVDGAFFFEKNAPRHTPDWIRTVTLPAPGSTSGRETLDYAIVEDLPTLVYFANLAALELHVPMWRVDGSGAPLPPDTVVFDLDPGAPATVVECCLVASLIRHELDADGITARPKTSGGKGLQLYAPWDGGDPSAYAKGIARKLEKRHPASVVSVMTRKARPGRVFIDWSQNSTAKTTVAPYSLRAQPRPTVSTPLTWDEVERCEEPEDLVFTSADVLARVEERGDLFAGATGTDL
ncbi:bifunctional non-homologous end joining protein LigD [Sinosporangium album]|uniref:Bifunctional non-homologous end joining protein LigD n=1 Tax=Sinosporangium album TaxID=504805 RepID=A0A1G7Y8B6_9ACTN|nr:non-homologous end-joining DNA ligase [Sinosporangium album]SDG92556.1 bifunctional non-homologous end joining protein LigD [Sinosporangium album]